MSETAILGIAGIIGTLLGVVWGQSLAGAQADRALRRQAYLDYSAIQLEALQKAVEMRAAAQAGRQVVNPLRGEFAREFLRATTLIQIVARPKVYAHAIDVSDLFRELSAVQAANPAADTANAEKDVMAALYVLNAAAAEDLRPWWWRLRPRRRT